MIPPTLAAIEADTSLDLGARAMKLEVEAHRLRVRLVFVDDLRSVDYGKLLDAPPLRSRA